MSCTSIGLELRGIRQRIKRHTKQPIGKRTSERVKRAIYEKTEAGEGNRTLVFSLEVSK
jgi:hypothetical protein